MTETLFYMQCHFPDWKKCGTLADDVVEKSVAAITCYLNCHWSVKVNGECM